VEDKIRSAYYPLLKALQETFNLKAREER